MKIDFFKNLIWNAKSERGFTLVELIMATVVTGTVASTLVIPFVSGIKEATVPEIYASAVYLAQAEMEEFRSEGYLYTVNTTGLGTTSDTSTHTDGRVYTIATATGYVDGPTDTTLSTVTATEYVRVNVTVSNSRISTITLWTILAEDIYDPNGVPL